MKSEIIRVANLNFDSSPSGVRANVNSVVNIVATSSGRVIGGSGTRIWDSAITPATSIQNISQGGIFKFPLSNLNLPAYDFDAIIKVLIDGVLVPVGISNSPDNINVLSEAATDKNLFWIDLYCLGLNNNFGSPDTANKYMFGGDGTQLDRRIAYRLYFTNPTDSPLRIDFNLQYFSYSLGANIQSLNTGFIDVPIGSQEIVWLDKNIILDCYSRGGGLTYNTAGYYKISFNVSDFKYRSVLPYYHWGIAD